MLALWSAAGERQRRSIPAKAAKPINKEAEAALGYLMARLSHAGLSDMDEFISAHGAMGYQTHWLKSSKKLRRLKRSRKGR